MTNKVLRYVRLLNLQIPKDCHPEGAQRQRDLHSSASIRAEIPRLRLGMTAFIQSCVLLVLPMALGACSPLYVIRAGYEEAKILSRREPIAELVNDTTVPVEKRRKLQLVLDARQFADQHLHLEVGDSYTTFSQLDSDTLALVLSAARKDRFEAYTWWFPIIGDVPYKGFFDEEDARDAIRDLEEDGYDTYLRPTAAFSTLGWFNDPLVSTLLRYDSVSLANTVIHELFHNTLYLSGAAAFNESLANFVGARGAIAFFCGRPAFEGECARAEGLWHDELIFGRFLSDLVGELETLYRRDDLAFEETLELREEVFSRALITFRDEVQPQFKVASFSSFTSAPLNNATLISRRLYYDRLGLFERVYQRYGGDLSAAIEAIVRVAEEGEDPYRAVEGLVGGWKQPGAGTGTGAGAGMGAGMGAGAGTGTGTGTGTGAGTE